MKFTLKSGEVVEIRKWDKSVTGKKLLEFFAPIIRERPQPFLHRDTVPTLKEENQWVKTCNEKIKKKIDVKIVAWADGKIIGIVDGRKGEYRDSDKVSIGISITKKYRGKGLGKKLLNEIIKLARKKFKPKIIYLTVFADNKNAVALYKKVGFHIIATLHKWQFVRKKYRDYLYMRLK